MIGPAKDPPIHGRTLTGDWNHPASIRSGPGESRSSPGRTGRLEPPGSLLVTGPVLTTGCRPTSPPRGGHVRRTLPSEHAGGAPARSRSCWPPPRPPGTVDAASAGWGTRRSRGSAPRGSPRPGDGFVDGEDSCGQPAWLGDGHRRLRGNASVHGVGPLNSSDDVRKGGSGFHHDPNLGKIDILGLQNFFCHSYMMGYTSPGIYK